MRIAAMGDRETVAGFELAGVSEGYVAKNDFEAEKAIKKIFNTPGIAVVFITADIYPYVKEQVNERRSRGEMYPIIVEIPPMGGEIKEDPIREIVRRAVGIDMEK